MEGRQIVCAEKDKCTNPICVHKIPHNQSKSCEVYCMDTQHYMCRSYLEGGEVLHKREFIISSLELESLLKGKTKTVMLFEPNSRDWEIWTHEGNPPQRVILVYQEGLIIKHSQKEESNE